MPLHGRRFASVSITSGSPPPLGGGGDAGSGSGGTSLSNGVSGQGSIKLAKGFVLDEIHADKSCRIEFYDTLAHATADARRKIGAAPKKGSGLQGEFIFTASNQTIVCDPPVVVKNGDTPQTDTIYYRITNLSGSPATITLTLTYTPYIE